MAEKKGRPLVLGILIVIVLVVVYLIVKANAGDQSLSGTGEPSKPTISLSKSGFQAVVMNNDQIYVGKVDDPNDQFVKVNEAYRLIASQSQEKSSTDLKLIKLEEGIHGPTNTMLINRDHIVIIEDLRSDSKLLEIIKNYRSAPAS